MKEITGMNRESTMTIREISEVLGSRPEDTLRSAKRLEGRGVIKLLSPANGVLLIDQRLNKLDSITLVAQNKPEFTKAIVTRWDELENEVLIPKMDVRDSVLLPVYEEEAKLYLEHVRTEHKRKMEALDQKFDQEMEMLEIHKQQTIIDKKLTVYADMIASKKVLPNETITYLLQKHQSTIKPSEANYILYREGYLQLNENSGGRYVVTKKGKKFGLSIRQGNTYNTRFFISTFPELLRKIEKSF